MNKQNRNPTFKDKDIAQHVRRKRSCERLTEEHEWVSIDCKLNHFLYNRSFKPHSEYDLRLGRNDIFRLLSLPNKLQRAFGHINTLQEFRAYLLLFKFYIVQNKHDWQEEDTSQCCIDVENKQLDINLVGRRLASLHDIRLFLQDKVGIADLNWCESESSRYPPITFNTREEASISSLRDLDSVDPKVHPRTFLVLHDLENLTDGVSFRAETFKTYCHKISLENCWGAKRLKKITISIIFQGTFIGKDYIPGKLSARLAKTSDEVGYEDIGTALPSLQILNTFKNLGRLVIEYEPKNVFEEGTYALYVSAFSEYTYNISISGKIMYDTEAFLTNELHSFVVKRNKARELICTLDEIMLDMRIHEKEVALIKELWSRTKQSTKEIERNLEAEEFQMDHDDTLKYESQTIVIEELERKLILQCNRLSSQERVQDNVRNEMTFLEEEKRRVTHELLQQEVENDDMKIGLQSCLSLSRHNLLENITRKIIKLDSYQTGPRRANHLFSSEPGTCSYIDRSRALLREIDRVRLEEKPLVASIMLHSMPQLFPKGVLIEELERLLDCMASKMIRKQGETEASILKTKEGINDVQSLTYTLDTEDVEEKTPVECSTSNDGPIQSQIGNYCIACDSNSCIWASTIDYESALIRREELTHLIVETKRQNSKRFSSKNGSKHEDDSFRQAALEAQYIDDKCKLHCVDMELHNAILKRRQKYTITRALHNYDSMMFTEDAIYALEREHNRLVAKISALEVIDDVLEWMDRGWYFGPPATAAESITNQHVSRRLTQDQIIQTIHRQSTRDGGEKKVAERRIKNVNMLKRTEKTIKMSILCITLRYFAAIKSIRKQKGGLSFERDRANEESSERLKMANEQEKSNKRDELLRTANLRAREGILRITKRKMHEVSTKSKRLNIAQVNLTEQNSSSQVIQKHYRGRLGRKATATWKYNLESTRAWNALCHASAIAISKCWRGHSARKLCTMAEASITQYIVRIRKEEAEDDEQDYKESIRRHKYWKRS